MPEHPRAPQPLGRCEGYYVFRVDGAARALLATQLTRRGIAALYAGCPDLLTATWPNRRRAGGWDAHRAAETIIGHCGRLPLLWPRQMEALGLEPRYRWRHASGRVELVSMDRLQQLADDVLRRSA
jgi:hypothetical protein